MEAPPPPPTSEVIMQPAKSEDKLEIEREEKEKEEKGNEDGKDAEGAEDEKKDDEVRYVPLLAICAPFYLGLPLSHYVQAALLGRYVISCGSICGRPHQCSHNRVFTIYRKRKTTRRRRTRRSPRPRGAAEAAARESSN